MNKMIKVSFRNIMTKEFEENTSLLEISNHFRKWFNFPILVGSVNNHIVELSKLINNKCNIDFYDRSSSVGNDIYAHSLQLMLILAVKRVLGKDQEIIIEHSIDKGVFCTIRGCKIDKNDISKIEKEMHNITEQDLIFTKLSVSRIDAINYFQKMKQPDKVKVLKYISNSYVNLYRLDFIYDYFFSEMAYSTKDIDDFKLTYIKNNGFVLSYPNIYNPECTLDYEHRPMIFNAFLEYSDWGKKLGIENAADLNEVVSTGKYNNLILLAEAYYNSQLTRVADEIYDHKDNIKVVLLAGPSSSGKTTTSKKLEIHLQSKGFKTHTISIDDYFFDRKDTPKDAEGNYDFESVRAIDTNLFNKHLSDLLDGKKVLLPEYNFVLGKREYKNKYLQMHDDDIIVIEGLHALNDELTLSVERKCKYKIFISPLTQINIDNHNRIHTSDTRRLRRIIRDNKHRGYNAAQTLKMWKKIREGEQKYIFPCQEDTDAIINSALLYELGVLKTYAEPLLFSVPETDEVYPEALRLINFLRNFLPIPSDEVPKDSVLREFIDGSFFS